MAENGHSSTFESILTADRVLYPMDAYPFLAKIGYSPIDAYPFSTKIGYSLFSAYPFLAKIGHSSFGAYPFLAKIVYSSLRRSTLTAGRMLYPITA